MKKHLRIFTGIILAVTLLLSACADESEGNGDRDRERDSTSVSASENKEDPSVNTDITEDGTVSISVDAASGELTVKRKKYTGTGNPALLEGWTVMVYLCGSDLESDSGMATFDMEEMLEASESDRVKFLVQTGGSSVWNNDVVDAEKLQRYVIQNGEIVLVDEQQNASMGNPDTLSDFMAWGLKNHMSCHNGLILWNHGGGSITGVCFDELFDQDSIDITELDSAIDAGLKEAGFKLDFIGFDACLMGNVETANIVATYADYMYCSEEIEPGTGWDYVAIGDYLALNPGCDGAGLGKVVADSFLKSCEDGGDDDVATFSVIDLSKIDNLLSAFNAFAKDMYEAGEDATKRADIVRSIGWVDNFGGNNKTEGYTNMVDLGGIIEACASYSKNADAARKALSDAVVYSVSGYMHGGVSGLSTYYPLSIQGSEELAFFSKICISPYYLSFVDRQGNLGAAGNMDAEYDDDTWFDDDGEWYWGDWDYYDDDYWDYLNDYEITGESPYITFDTEPTFEKGYYYFVLDEYGLYNASDVYGIVCIMSPDQTEIIEFGETYDINADWEEGIFYDDFDGWWLSLPDGQNLATYIVDYDDESITYTSPVLLNDVETNLRIRMTEDSIIIEGAWNGIDEETGAAARDIIKLRAGDRIVPVYYAWDLDGNDAGEYVGDEYLFDGEPQIYYDRMHAGDYLYAFCIDDIYGDYYMTDFEFLTIDENGDVLF